MLLLLHHGKRLYFFPRTERRVYFPNERRVQRRKLHDVVLVNKLNMRQQVKDVHQKHKWTFNIPSLLFYFIFGLCLWSLFIHYKKQQQHTNSRHLVVGMNRLNCNTEWFFLTGYIFLLLFKLKLHFNAWIARAQHKIHFVSTCGLLAFILFYFFHSLVQFQCNKTRSQDTWLISRVLKIFLHFHLLKIIIFFSYNNFFFCKISKPLP